MKLVVGAEFCSVWILQSNRDINFCFLGSFDKVEIRPGWLHIIMPDHKYLVKKQVVSHSYFFFLFSFFSFRLWF